MPCSDGGWEPRGRVEYRTPPEVQDRLDISTRLLCSLLTQMTDEEVAQQPDEMQVWWAKHQVEDIRRLAREAEAKERKKVEAAERRERKKVAMKAKRVRNEQREAGLAKLSESEKAALGL